jgi:hypothetical protein
LALSLALSFALSFSSRAPGRGLGARGARIGGSAHGADDGPGRGLLARGVDATGAPPRGLDERALARGVVELRRADERGFGPRAEPFTASPSRAEAIAGMPVGSGGTLSCLSALAADVGER